MATQPSPLREADDAARDLARALISGARFAALAVLDEAQAPSVTRVGLATDDAGTPVSLISGLSAHTAALLRDPRCGLLVGEPHRRGDPLTHPRLSISARAVFLGPDDPARQTLRARYLRLRPKSRLYADFADFRFVRFEPVSAFLNAGFGRAYVLTPEDLAASPPAQSAP